LTGAKLGTGTNLTCGHGGHGAGIYNSGSLVMSNCLVADNYCGSGGAIGAFKGLAAGGFGGSGGGVYNTGFLSVNNTTITANTAGDGGAGPVGNNADPAVLLGGNGGSGGGVLNAGRAVFINATVCNNWRGFGGSAGISFGSNYVTGTSGVTGLGGGLHSVSNAVTLMNSVFTGNHSDIDSAAADVTGSVTSLGHNLVGVVDLTSTGLGVAGDVLGSASRPVEAKLDILASNGGPLPTCALLEGSPAIDAGDDAVLAEPWNLLTDARGGWRLAGDHVDIGAYEYGSSTNLVPKLKISRGVGGHSVDVSLVGNPARTFDILASTNLAQWTRLTTVTNVYGRVGCPVSTSSNSFQFLRARENP
jgi:hypothetical protein